MNLLAHYVAALLTTAITLFSVGIFAYLKNRRGKVNQAFTIFVLSATIWSFGEAQLIIAQDRISAIFLARLLHVGVIFIPTFFLHFIFELIEIRRKKQKIFKAAYIFGFIFLIFNNFTKLLIPSATPKFSFNYYWNTGILYPYYITGWFAIVIYGLYELRKAYLHSTGGKRNQLKYVFWAPLIGYAGGVGNYLPAFNIEIYPYNPFGTYGVPVFSIMIAYAIIKYRLMDINVVFGKLATYSVLLFIIGGICLGLMRGVDRVFSGFPGYDPRLSHFLIFLLLSLALIYFILHIKTKAEQKIETLLFKDKYRYREVLGEFNKRLSFISQEEDLLNETVENIANLMGVSKVAIILLDELSDNYVIKAQRGLIGINNKQAFNPNDRTIKWLAENKKTLLAEEMEKILQPEEVERIKSELKRLEVNLCLPLVIKDRLAGLLALGEKRSREMFFHLDIELLESLSDQLALAISYKRLEAQILRSNRLVSLGTLAAGMAHEIRNPLSSIQTFAQLLPEKYNDREFREEFSKIVASDTQRISRLIESIMALASPRPPVAVSCNINELLEETLFLVEGEIKRNGIEVVKNYDRKLPLIEADKEQLKQAFLNIFLNSLEVLHQGGGRLIISTRSRFTSSIFTTREERYVQVKIRDNGPGIEEKLLGKIFEPFFTTRANGTGLGLAIVDKIIKQHAGLIEVQSEVDKGTVFLISLPLEVKNA